MTQQGLGNEHQVYPNVNMPFVDSKDGRVTPPWQRFLLSLWHRSGGAIANSGSGYISLWAGKDIPDGYLLCDGQEVSRLTYSELFSAIGTVWGEGDGKETFNVPNLTDKFVRGSRQAGETGGSDTTTISLEQIPAHTHEVVDPGHIHVVVDPGHVHTVTDPEHFHHGVVISGLVDVGAGPDSGVVDGDGELAATGITVDSALTGVSVASALTGISIGTTGSGQGIDVLPSFATVVYVIKT